MLKTGRELVITCTEQAETKLGVASQLLSFVLDNKEIFTLMLVGEDLHQLPCVGFNRVCRTSFSTQLSPKEAMQRTQWDRLPGDTND